MECDGDGHVLAEESKRVVQCVIDADDSIKDTCEFGRGEWPTLRCGDQRQTLDMLKVYVRVSKVDTECSTTDISTTTDRIAMKARQYILSIAQSPLQKFELIQNVSATSSRGRMKPRRPDV